MTTSIKVMCDASQQSAVAMTATEGWIAQVGDRKYTALSDGTVVDLFDQSASGVYPDDVATLERCGATKV